MQFKFFSLFLLYAAAIIAAPLFPTEEGQVGELERIFSSELSAARAAVEEAEQKLNAFIEEKETVFGPKIILYNDPDFKQLILKNLFLKKVLKLAEEGKPALTTAEAISTLASLELDFELTKAYAAANGVAAAKRSAASLYEAANAHIGVRDALFKKVLTGAAVELQRAITPGEERTIIAKLELQMAIARVKLHLNQPVTEEVLLRQPEVFQAIRELQDATIAELAESEEAAILAAEQNHAAAAA